MQPFNYTFAPAFLFKASDSDARYDFVIGNLERAIPLLKTIQPHQHHQSIWAEDRSENVCGTAGCALGWIAMTNVVPGLQYTKKYDDDYHAVVNGDVEGWGIAGEQFFGSEIAGDVFGQSHLDMPVIIKLLETCLKDYKRDRMNPCAVRPVI